MSSQKERVTLRSYTIGFLLSIILTLGVYWLVSEHVNSGHVAFAHSSLVIAIALLAIVQFVVQALFFLHVGHELKPRWRLMVFGFMIMVVVIVVGGSLWIMQNLDQNMAMPASDAKTYMRNHEGL